MIRKKEQVLYSLTWHFPQVEIRIFGFDNIRSLYIANIQIVSDLFFFSFPRFLSSGRTFSAIIYTEFWIRQSGITGITDASITRRFLVPWITSRGSTTPWLISLESRQEQHGSIMG